MRMEVFVYLICFAVVRRDVALQRLYVTVHDRRCTATSLRYIIDVALQRLYDMVHDRRCTATSLRYGT